MPNVIGQCVGGRYGNINILLRRSFNDIQELVHNCDKYQARVLFKNLRRQGNKGYDHLPFDEVLAEVLAIDIVEK